jgi:hypothetical protein
MAIKFLNTVAVDNDVLYVDASANKVGIGTTSPNTALEVDGAITTTTSDYVQGTTGSRLILETNGSGNTHSFIQAQNSGGTSNAEDLALQLYGGNVGIGTDSPDTKLHIADSTSPIFTFERLDTTTIANEVIGQFNFKSTDSSDTGVNASIKVIKQDLSVATVPMAITFETGVSGTVDERMRIDPVGNVGIGTTSPTSLLEISKQLSAASTIDYPYTISSRDDANSINQAGGEGVGIKFRIAGNAATTPGDSLIGASIAAIREVASDADSSTGLGFFVTQNDETLDEAIRIDHDGNVGIGTTGPGEKLEITGSTPTAGDTTLHLKVPVGNITAGLTEMGNILFSSSDASGNGTGSVAKISTIAGNGSGAWVGGGRPTDLAFFTQPLSSVSTTLVEAMRIDQNGNVGIGTTSPKSKLDVNSVFCVDSKEHTITNAFTTCLTVNLTSHTGCHVVITAFGDWGVHSSAAYRGEFFLQNGANIYNEPGIILRQDDNTSDGTDQIICQIVDPTSTANPKDFQIQIRHTDTTSPASFVAQLTYTVQGKFNSIT